MLFRSSPFGGNKADLMGRDWGFVMLCGLVLFGAAVLVAVPIFMSNRRRSPHGEGILAGSLLWGVAAAWSGISWVIALWDWSKERNALLLAGYYDTVAADPGPEAPRGRWIALACLFLVLLGLSFRRDPKESGEPATGSPLEGPSRQG